MTYINSTLATDSGDIPLQIALISAYRMPHRLMYKAMHNDFSEESITKEIAANKIPDEEKCKDILVKRLLSNHRGHFGVLEHCPLIFHLIGVNPLSLVALKQIPSVIIREYPEGANIIYLKCNCRSFLAIMDYWYLNGSKCQSLEITFDSMWKLYEEYVPTIANWYVTERRPMLARKQQSIF